MSAGLRNHLLVTLLCGALLLGANPSPAAQPATAGPATAAADASAGGGVAAARAAAAAHPESAPEQVRLGYLLLATAPEEALRHFDQALALNPNSAEAKTGRGSALAGLGRHQEAEQTLMGALSLNPNPVRVHYELGRLYQKLGEHEKAIIQFKEGIRKHEQGRI